MSVKIGITGWQYIGNNLNVKLVNINLTLYSSIGYIRLYGQKKQYEKPHMKIKLKLNRITSVLLDLKKIAIYHMPSVPLH